MRMLLHCPILLTLKVIVNWQRFRLAIPNWSSLIFSGKIKVRVVPVIRQCIIDIETISDSENNIEPLNISVCGCEGEYPVSDVEIEILEQLRKNKSESYVDSEVLPPLLIDVESITNEYRRI